MEQANAARVSSTAANPAASRVGIDPSPVLLQRVVTGAPTLHVIHPDVWVVEKAHDNFWVNQSLPLATIVGVALGVIGKWIWDAGNRKYRLKRKLYFETIDCMTECGNVLSSFCDPTATLSSLQQRFVSATAVIAKTELVANTKLCLAIADVKDLMGAMYNQAIRTRIPLERHRADSDRNEPGIQTHWAEINWVKAELRRMRTDGIRDDARKTELERRQASAHEQLAPLLADQQVHAQAIGAVVSEVADLVMDRQDEILVLTARVKQMMRKDLGFRANHDVLVARQAETIEKAKAELVKTRGAIAEGFRTE